MDGDEGVPCCEYEPLMTAPQLVQKRVSADIAVPHCGQSVDIRTYLPETKNDQRPVYMQ